MMVALRSISTHLFWSENQLLTQSLIPGKPYFGEKKISLDGIQYRVWNPNHSKIAAALCNGLKEFPIREGSRVLYLGVAEGKTASFLSDIVGERGLIVGIDVSPVAIHAFSSLCDLRSNLVPILGDANHPESYEKELKGISFDAIVQDISQKNQSEIFLKNAEKFLKPKGFGLLSIKSQSINSAQKPTITFEKEKTVLEKGCRVIQSISLEPFEKAHEMVVCQKNK